MIKLKKHYMKAVLSAVILSCLAGTSEAAFAEESLDTKVQTESSAVSEGNGTVLSVEDEAIARINQGQDSVSDYTQLKIRYVKDENISIIKQAIKEAKEKKQADLVKTEISQTVAGAIKNINNSLSRIRAGSASLEDYKLLQAGSVTNENLADINKFISAKGSVTITKVKEYADEFSQIILRINNGSESISDYAEAGIENVNADNIKFIRQDIKDAKAKKGSDLAKGEIVLIVSNIAEKVNAVLKNINAGTASLNDYELIGCSTVTEENIADVNAVMKNQNLSELNEIKSRAEVLINALNNINAGQGTLDDYQTLDIFSADDILNEANKAVLEKKALLGRDLNKSDISVLVEEARSISDLYMYIDMGNAVDSDYAFVGVSGVKENNIEYLNKVLESNRCWTLVSLQKAADAVIIPINNINEVTDKASDYEALAIQGVTSENIDLVKIYIKAQKAAEGRDLTRDEIKTEVDKALYYLGCIEKINEGKADLNVYNAVGINGVDDKNIKFVNEKIAGSSCTSKEEIQGMADKIIVIYNAFVKINEGEANAEDYKTAGVIILRTDLLNKINEAVKGQKYFTAEEVQDKADEVVNSAVFAKINRGQATVKDYITLGVNNVTAKDLAFVNISLRGKNIKTKDQLQKTVDFILEVHEAILKSEKIIAAVNDGQATVEDYDYLGIIGVDEENLWFVKADLKGRNFDNAEDIQNRVDEINEVFVYYQRINLGTAELEDYTAIGVNGVNKDNLSYINENIKGSNFIKAEDVQAKVTALAKLYDAFVKINNGTAEAMDYVNVGVKNVTDANVIYVNVYTKGHNLFKTKGVQKIVDVNVDVCNALARINAGVGTLADYKLIDAETVADDNYIYVNGNIGRYGLIKVEEVRTKVADIVVQYYTNLKIQKALKDINDGNGTTEEYDLIKANGVTVENLKYVNAELKGKNYSDQYVIQDVVNTIIKNYPLIQKVNLGQATVEDYKTLGISGVKSENLEYVSADLRGKNSLTKDQMQIIIDSNMKKYLALVNTQSITKFEYKGHWYAAVDIKIQGWNWAKSYAEGLGGHLAVITDEQENNFIVQTVIPNGNFPDYALGIKKLDNTILVTVTGEKENYTNWSENEPNNDYTVEGYVETYRNGKWNDLAETMDYGGRITGMIIEWE